MGKDVGEIDFVVQHDGRVLPIEAKSGKHCKMHAALDNMLGNSGYGVDKAIVLSDYNTSQDPKIDYLPVYLVMFLEHDQLPSDSVFRLPSLGNLKVNPHFK